MPAIPSSGAVSLSDFATEFGGTAPHSMSEYYRDGGNVPSNNTNVPTSGLFRFSNMRGAINAIIQTLSNTTNVDLSTVFGTDWASSVPKEVIIPSGVTIGGTGSSDALTAPSGMGGTLTITNAGSVIGFGGTSGGNGGNAIRIASTGITVNNSGLIAGGGGGGGAGGNGGAGGAGLYDTGVDGTGYLNYTCTSCSGGTCAAVTSPGIGVCNVSIDYGVFKECITGSCCMGDCSTRQCWYHCYRSTGSGGTGGSGGAGAVGQGYNQSAGTGSSGNAGGNGSGGTYGSGSGGTGGTGGNGGAYGVAGTSGSSGSSGSNGYLAGGSGGASGASGGAAGAAVIYTAAYTMNNSGTLAGAA